MVLRNNLISKGGKTMKKIKSEKEARNQLGIEEIQHMTGHEVREFFQLYSKMDKEVALSFIKQFSEYKELAIESVETLQDMYNRTMEENGASHKEVLDAYKIILDDLSEIVRREDIGEQERNLATDKMILVADKIAQVNADNREWLSNLWKSGVTAVLSFAALGVTYFGIKTMSDRN